MEDKNFSRHFKFQIDSHGSIKSSAAVADALNWSATFVNRNYKMDHPTRGKAIIFNHYRFISQRSKRTGTASDVKNLMKALTELGFKLEEIDVHEDLSAADIADELKKVQQEDHTNKDLLMIFVLTHGSRHDKISAYDAEYPVETLWEPFRADRCKTLAGKPKIFFVIACRGECVDLGHSLSVEENESTTEVDARPVEFYNSIPVWSDFLYIFSTYKGYLSYRDIEDGTWYIQAFCEELSETNISQISFTDFLTAVNGRLSTLFEAKTFFETKKQISTFSSTLTKCLYFTREKKTILKT